MNLSLQSSARYDIVLNMSIQKITRKKLNVYEK